MGDVINTMSTLNRTFSGINFRLGQPASSGQLKNIYSRNFYGKSTHHDTDLNIPYCCLYGLTWNYQYVYLFLLYIHPSLGDRPSTNTPSLPICFYLFQFLSIFVSQLFSPCLFRFPYISCHVGSCIYCK